MILGPFLAKKNMKIWLNISSNNISNNIIAITTATPNVNEFCSHNSTCNWKFFSNIKYGFSAKTQNDCNSFKDTTAIYPNSWNSNSFNLPDEMVTIHQKFGNFWHLFPFNVQIQVDWWPFQTGHWFQMIYDLCVTDSMFL